MTPRRPRESRSNDNDVDVDVDVNSNASRRFVAVGRVPCYCETSSRDRVITRSALFVILRE